MRLAPFLAAAICTAAALATLPAFAKLPALSDEAKVKAAEAAAKAAWGDKIAGFQLCKAQDRSAGNYAATMKQAGKAVNPATATAACADPGPFVAADAASAASPTATVPALAPAAKKS